MRHGQFARGEVIAGWFGNERRAGASEIGDGEGQRKVRGEEREQDGEGLRIWSDERKGRSVGHTCLTRVQTSRIGNRDR
jgi:hypothetical protein